MERGDDSMSKRFEQRRQADALRRGHNPDRPLTKAPSYAKMEAWMDRGIAKATDGCWVEPDGTCEHGCRSWMLVLGVI
jgi:hypothetical protein